MYRLEDNEIVREIKCGNNFAYILEDNGHFMNTDYKVLQSQTSGIFVQCMKMMYNGKTELYYLTEDYKPMSSMFVGIMPETLIAIIVNLFANVIEVRNNGFLTCQNIDLSWDKIFIDASTLKVKLVYLPINTKIFDSYAEFENELRTSLVRLINKVITTSNTRLDKFSLDLCNGSFSLEDVYNKSRAAGTQIIVKSQQSNIVNTVKEKKIIKIVAMNAPKYFEIVIDRDEIIIGKKAEVVDAVIQFNKMISRKHCKVTRNNGDYYITDEGSANGTYVNRKRILPNQPCKINRGDIIRLADSDFQIV
ncbi:FHA domain-containing protein [uncultured Clostridium sp.]|uniref:FHA domain-containing protein n=1 Tax=uncultured Clostridium sp. TaxID=59620 RepID=UPI0025F48793|nr:FHA domain-containing protein [uncultured Clostridium sp.]